MLLGGKFAPSNDNRVDLDSRCREALLGMRAREVEVLMRAGAVPDTRTEGTVPARFPPVARLVTSGMAFARGISDPDGRVTLSAYLPWQTVPAHQHSTPHVCLVLAGDLVQEGRGHKSQFRLGDAAVHPAGDQHCNTIGPNGAVCLNLRIDEEAAPPRFCIRPVDPLVRLKANRIASDLTLGRADALAIDSLIAELTSPPGKCDGPVARVLEALETRRPWSLKELARIAGRHPGHLARSFRRTTGHTIGGYRRHLRLRDVLLDLRTDPASLGELAARHGYSDQAHMTREVKQATGAPPGAWRETL